MNDLIWNDLLNQIKSFSVIWFDFKSLFKNAWFDLKSNHKKSKLKSNHFPGTSLKNLAEAKFFWQILSETEKFAPKKAKCSPLQVFFSYNLFIAKEWPFFLMKGIYFCLRKTLLGLRICTKNDLIWWFEIKSNHVKNNDLIWFQIK